jgi:voltage-dependent potassium channel beta subunit
MQYNRLGKSGLRVSRFSIGSWASFGVHVDEAKARKILTTAIEGGVNFIDNAEAYAGGRAEKIVGSVISDFRRESLVISSKVFWGGSGPNDRGLSRKHVVEACHGALRRLGIDYLDLYFCHRPDPETPVLETALAMDILIRQGKVLYWGTSEWTVEQLRELYTVCENHGLIKPQMEQPQYNMFHRLRVESELRPLYEEQGLGTTVWSPLASGILTGKYNDGIPKGSRLDQEQYKWLASEVTPERVQKVRDLSALAADLGCSMAQLALAWAARDPSQVSTVLTGASRPSQVEENLKAEAVIEKLTPPVLLAIERILEG